MKKKQYLITILLVAFVMVLVLTQKFFDANFKQAALLDNNISSMKEYVIEEEHYSYSLPETWQPMKKVSNSYKVYQAGFNSEEKDIMGYVELLSTDEDVKALAQKDIDNLSLKCSKEKVENYSCKNYKGIKTEYKTKVDGGYSFINSNYYLKLSDNLVCKFAFTAKNKAYKDNMNAIYDVIVSSIKATDK